MSTCCSPPRPIRGLPLAALQRHDLPCRQEAAWCWGSAGSLGASSYHLAEALLEAMDPACGAAGAMGLLKEHGWGVPVPRVTLFLRQRQAAPAVWFFSRVGEAAQGSRAAVKLRVDF